MKHEKKVQVRPESAEKQQEHNAPIQSQETATPTLANLAQTGVQHLPPSAVARLSGVVGNRAVARLMAQRGIPSPNILREGEDEEEIEGPRTLRQEDTGGEEEEEIEGPRTMPLREDALQQRGGGQSLSTAQRGTRVAGLSAVGDSSNLDNEGLYGWDRPMSATDVANVVNNLVFGQGAFSKGKRIVIFSGTHGNSSGNLNPTGAAGFVGEDQATANAVMSASPESQIEVIDVPNTYATKASLTAVFGMTNYIRILAWCYSKRSYNNQATLKSKWWPVPDKY